MKTVILAALLALTLAPGLAAANTAEAHLDIDANGERHTVDVIVADDGTATVLVDGQPPAVPTLP